MAEIAAIRILPERDFVVLRNEAMRDPYLSFRARGVLAWLLSHAPGYSVTAAELRHAGPEGRDAIRTALRELEARGYLVRHRLRAVDGTFAHQVVASDKPIRTRPHPVDKAVDNPVDNGAPQTGFQAPVFQAI